MTTNRYKTVLKKIILKLGKGLKSSKTQYCLGEEIDLQLEEIIVPSEGVKAVPPTDLNTLARWNKSDGSELTGSKTTQDNSGNTTTTSTVDGELKELLENLSSSDAATVVYHLRSLVKTMIRQEITDKQIWDTYIDATSKSYIVRGQNLEDPTQTGDFFKINRKGNFSTPFQYRAIAILESDTTNVTGDGTNYQHGSAKALNVLKDQGNQFFGGDGAGTPAKYTILEQNTYLVYMHITFNSTGDKPAELINRIITASGRTYIGRGFISGGIGNSSVSLLIGIDAEAGDFFNFVTVAFANPSSKVISFSGTALPIFTTYIGVYCLG